MAQPRVTDYFTSKKKTKGGLPAKRRKLSHNDDDISVIKQNAQSILQNASLDHPAECIEKNVSISTKSISSTKTRRKQHKKTDMVSTPTVRSSRRKGVSNVDKSQQNIINLLTNSSVSSTICSETADLDETSKMGLQSSFCVDTESIKESENLSLQWDEHDGLQHKDVTPQKQIKTDSKNERKSRHCKDPGLTTPCDKNCVQIISLAASTRNARKCLQLHSEPEESLEVKTEEKDVCVDGVVSEMTVVIPKISPLPGSPHKLQQSTTNSRDKTMSAKVMASIKICKELTDSVDVALSKTKKLTASEVKSRLKKGGKLEELKEQLLAMNKLKKQVKKDIPKLEQFNKIEIEVEQTSPVKLENREQTPAFQKFHHLITAPPPTLNLPYKYKQLSEMFRGMDTVVSMMHNRSESCTYSKLKAAVQSMTKRNFEQKNIGQIKTVYPMAYTFRQERVPMFGQKVSDYQLTVEARLEDENVCESKEDVQRRTFSASHLLRRRQTFKTGLISIVKSYHKDFLSKLDRPLNIPESMITRWHPSFPLDEVPDIAVAPLPEAPVVYKYETAKDVLEHTRGKILQKVEKALESVAVNSPSTKLEPTQKNEPPKAEPRSHKGISLSLLQKIRAKEAMKLEAALTRDPQEDRKTGMMGRLPDLIRILRMYYITEKKPAVPLASVVQKLCDSSKTPISLSEMENHIKLLLEICPEWISVVEIKRGKYIKLDRNKDIQVLNTKIQNLIKIRK